MSTTITLTRPDDWHLHVRDGAALEAVIGHTAAQFARAVIMPNLKQPVSTTAQALGVNTDASSAHQKVAELPDLQALQAKQQSATHRNDEPAEQFSNHDVTPHKRCDHERRILLPYALNCNRLAYPMNILKRGRYPFQLSSCLDNFVARKG